MTTTPLHQIPSNQLEEIRHQMVKFAFLQLKDNTLAEDVVQEAFVSAYKYADRFKGESALKTWIFAILKNKIIDLMRSKSRLITETELLQNEERDLSETLFTANGMWEEEAYHSNEWKNIENRIHCEQFWQVFEVCLNRLPANQARVFMMRSHLEMATQEICRECEISSANLHTLLYRARLQLQVCLTQKWFGE